MALKNHHKHNNNNNHHHHEQVQEQHQAEIYVGLVIHMKETSRQN